MLLIRCSTAACLVPFSISGGFGQTNIAQLVATQVKAEVSSLDAKPTLATWRRSHKNEAVEPARFDIEYEGQGRWCASTVARIALNSDIELTRLALFYTPTPKPGSMPALPLKQDNSLVQSCKLLSLWYEVKHVSAVADLTKSVAQQLGESWGTPVAIPSRTANGSVVLVPERDLWGSGEWDPLFAWHHKHRSVLVAADPEGRPKEGPRLLVIARNVEAPPGISGMDTWDGGPPATQPSLAEAAARIAAIDPPLTHVFLLQLPPERREANLQRSSPTISPLLKWLEIAQDLPPQRKAAALIAADIYLERFFYSGVVEKSSTRKLLKSFGAVFVDTRDGVAYGHTLLKRAQRFAPSGPAAELAQIGLLEDACGFEGPKTDWREGLIAYGEKILRTFPSDQWTPYVHYILGRAYAAKLLFYYPGGVPDADDPENRKIIRAPASRVRAAAITHFRAFLEKQPNALDAAFAWQESWRLLAGLPPTRIGFGCTGD